MRNRFKSCFVARLLSCIIAISLVLSLGAPAVMAEEAAVLDAAAPLTDYEPSYEYIEAENFLSALGISNDIPEDITKNVTRGQFVDMYVRALNLGKIDKETRVFADVLRSHPYYDSITTAYNVGLVSGVREGYFEPDTEIMYEHTKALALKALGVTDTTINHYHFVKALNVPRNGDGITYENAIVLIYNMLKSNVVDITYSSNGTSFTYNKDTTLFNYIWQAYEVKGLVTSTEVASLGRTKACAEGQIEIDNTAYFTDLKNTYDFLGYNCIAIVSRKDVDAPRVLSLAKKIDEKVLELNSLNLKKGCYDGQKLYYTDDSGKEREAKISPTVYVLYNGAFAGSQFEKSIFDFDLGEVTLIDTDEDRVYDVAKILEYQYMHAAAKPSGDLMILQDQDDPAQYLQLTPKSNDLILDIEVDGQPAEISQIVTGDLVAYAQSPRDSSVNYLSIKINREKITGKLSKTSKKTWTIGERDMIASDFIRQNPVTKGDIPSMGVLGTYSLDFLGRLVLFEAEENEYVYGVLLEVANIEAAFSNGVKAKFFTTGSSIEVYEAPNGVRIDGVKYTSGDAARAYLTATTLSMYDPNATLCQIVKYKLDDNGNLHSIYTAYEGSSADKNENAPHISFPLATRYYAQAQGYCFGVDKVREFRCPNETLLFALPPKNAAGGVDEDKLYMFIRDFLNVRGAFSGARQNIAYDCDETGAAKAIAFEYEFTGMFDSTYPLYGLVRNKYTKLNEKGELVNEFEMVDKNGLYIYETVDETVGANVDKGDMVMYQYDSNKKIFIFDHIFDLSNQGGHGFRLENSTTFNGSKFRAFVGYVESFKDGYAYVTWDPAKAADPDAPALRHLVQLGSVYYNIYYVNSGETVAGDVVDLPNFVSSKKGEDVLLVLAEEGNVHNYTFYVFE